VIRFLQKYKKGAWWFATWKLLKGLVAALVIGCILAPVSWRVLSLKTTSLQPVCPYSDSERELYCDKFVLFFLREILLHRLPTLGSLWGSLL